MGYIPQIDNNADKEDNDGLPESKQKDDFNANTGTSITVQEIGNTNQMALRVTAR